MTIEDERAQHELDALLGDAHSLREIRRTRPVHREHYH